MDACTPCYYSWPQGRRPGSKQGEGAATGRVGDDQTSQGWGDCKAERGDTDKAKRYGYSEFCWLW